MIRLSFRAIFPLYATLLAGCTVAPVHVATSHTASPTIPIAAATRPVSSSLAARIDAFIAQPRFAHADWGIEVASLDNDRILYAHNANKLLIPASNAKLYTAALALDTLGADARMQTSLYATAVPRADGILDGDLILVGRGDPSLGNADSSPDWSDRFAAALVARGITRVHGDLVADDTFYQGPPIGSGWEANDLQAWFAPPVSALGVQDNVLHVRVSRDGTHCCAVTLDPVYAGVQLVNLTHDDVPGGDDELGLYRAPGSTTLYVSGSLPAGAQSRTYTLSVPDPARVAGDVLRGALTRRGIALDGSLRVLHWPRIDAALAQPTLQDIATIASPPLAELVRHTLKDSDNLYAQLFLLQVGAHTAQRGVCADRPHPPHTSEAWGLCAMRAMLLRAGIASDETNFDEGSGLSRKDLVTPAATVALLAWIQRQPFAVVLRDALPVAAIDGTLAHRLRDTDAAGNLQAKTGTLTGSYVLSGYVTDRAGRHLAFALMLDRYLRPTDAQGRPIAPSPTSDLDAIAAMLAGAGIPPG